MGNENMGKECYITSDIGKEDIASDIGRMSSAEGLGLTSDKEEINCITCITTGLFEHENGDTVVTPDKEDVTTESEEEEPPIIYKSIDLVNYEDNPESWKPIGSVEEFFSNGIPLNGHSLEVSPCFPIIGSRPGEETDIVYYCKLHPDMIPSTFLSEIELHCRKEPDIHKGEILEKSSRTGTGGAW